MDTLIPNAESTFEEFLNPIYIRPTAQEIQLATSQCIFGEITDPKNTSCPITLNVFNDNDEVTKINECGHLYTPTALTRWFHNNVQCPLCRCDIRESLNTPTTYTTTYTNSLSNDADL